MSERQTGEASDGVLESCPDCGALISRAASGGLLPHHPGFNAGTPNGKASLCPGGRMAYVEEDRLVIVRREWRCHCPGEHGRQRADNPRCPRCGTPAPVLPVDREGDTDGR